MLGAARPLHGQIARHEPFVMNTRVEIEQTLGDIRSGRFGPGGAAGWLIPAARSAFRDRLT